MSSRRLHGWDAKFACFLERVMATALTGGDPKPLQDELVRIMRDAPADKKLALETNGRKNNGNSSDPSKGRSVPTDDCEQGRIATVGSASGRDKR